MEPTIQFGHALHRIVLRAVPTGLLLLPLLLVAVIAAAILWRRAQQVALILLACVALLTFSMALGPGGVAPVGVRLPVLAVLAIGAVGLVLYGRRPS